MTPRPVLVSCYFGGEDSQFDRLAPVLAASAARHCATWDRRITRLERPASISRVEDAYVDNTHKLDFWNKAIQALPDGTDVLLIDADTVILKPLDEIWGVKFDIAYTRRAPGYKLPMNAGVVFVRVNARSRVFVAEWTTVNRQMLRDRQLHQPWRRRFGGINQAAFGYAMDRLSAGLSLLPIPCTEWNCEDSSWRDFNPEVTRILHLKSLLRRAVFNLSPVTSHVRPLVKLWRALEREVASV